MSTAAQIAANRANAQRSTGPRTDEGKAKTRVNALRHGLCGCVPLMHDETEADLVGLLGMLREEHQPADATEEILVYKMAEHFWYAKRASYFISEKMNSFDNYDDYHDKVGRDLSLMIRYHSTADRGYYKALTELRKLQQERRLQEIGSVPQTAEPAAETVPEKAAPVRPPDPKSTESAAPAVSSAPKTASEAVAPIKKAA
jgi:hypothetical protein